VRIAHRVVAFFALALAFAAVARADVAGYEWVTQGGRNNLIDASPSACDPVEGCYDRTGAPCSAHPSQICDLQIVPANRCTYGNLGPTGGPGGTNTCVWPHGAGHCAGNSHVGCVTDAYVSNPADTGSGASAMCTGTGNPTCDMGGDPLGGPFRPDCACSGTDPLAPDFETIVCAVPASGLIGVCSDGDPDRARGGYGFAFGFELNLGAGQVNSSKLGPAVNGSTGPSTSPRYAIENPPSLPEPQRGAGAINRPGPATAVHPVRTTEARERAPLDPSLGTETLRGLGNSYWADWFFENQNVSGFFHSHTVLLPCNAPLGWAPDQKIDPTPGAPGSGDEAYCAQLAKNSLAIHWNRDLTEAERAGKPCPPACRKDFDLTTVEIETVDAVAGLDANAGAQLALQSGEGRPAGGGDTLSFTPLTYVTWLNTNDARCRLGGWGSPNGLIGRCLDGPNACDPAANDINGNNPNCTEQGGSCRACNGPIIPTNPLGLPIGYDTHGVPELDLVAGERIGMIAGITALVSTPFTLVGTSGYAASDFRDLPGFTVGSLDLADMGQVDPNGPAFAVGIGTGGTFTNGSTLPIGATCCANGTSIVWAPANVGAPLNRFLRTFDAGPGPDGIPSCFGDNPLPANGLNACNQRLGFGANGPKTSGAFNTGLDDVAQLYAVGASGSIPASRARFTATPSTPSAFPAYNLVAAEAFRDRSVFGPQNLDALAKLDVSYCPIHDGHADCGAPATCSDDDTLNCVPGCFDPSAEPDADADGVPDRCDNCVFVANPREDPACFDSPTATCGPWATLTGGQRDDDHDGYGNPCDAKFTSTGALVGAPDLLQFRTSNGRNRTADVCGTSGTRPCAIFDLDDVSTLIGTADLARLRLLNGKAPGPKCANCPLTCTAGTAGSCF